MKLAKATLRLNKQMSVRVEEITPAQALYLAAEHHKKLGDQPIADLVEIGEVERTPKQEIDRLRSIYPVKKVNALFPGAIPQVPETFAEALEAGLEATLPVERLTTVDISR